MCAKGGADMARVREAIGGGFARSRILELHGQRMVDRDFAPRATMTVQRKDMRNALETAASLDFAAPITELFERLYSEAIDHGLADLDHSGLFVELARRYPMARHVFTGGSIDLIDGRDTEADVVRRIFARIGLDTTRIIFEDKSRNTFENARLSLEMIKPEPEETWLLITSARHMPRAVGTFRKAGWPNLVPYPIDFATDPDRPFDSQFRLGYNLNYLSEAIREYMGLGYYWYLKRTDALFPGPEAPKSEGEATPDAPPEQPTDPAKEDAAPSEAPASE
jgi:hypothetical protein